MHYKKSIVWLSPFLILFVFFTFLFIGLRNHSQSFYFQDETDHVALGWMMEEYGSILYKDLSTIHQPIPVLVGAVFSKIMRYQTLFQMVEELRIGMWLFQLLIAFLLVLRFRWRGLFSSTLLNSLSYLFFGWYVLAEALAAPFIIGLFLYFLEIFLEKAKLSIWDVIALSFSIFWVGFNLVPLWPFLVILTLFFFFKVSQINRRVLVSSLFIFTFLLFTIVPFQLWLEETLYHLVRYYLPYNQELSRFGLLQLLAFPMTSFLYLDKPLALMIGGGLGLVAVFVFKSKDKQYLFKVMLSLFLIILLNNRVIDIRKVFYEGFHLYPFIAGMSAFLGYFFVKAIASTKRINQLIIVSIFLVILVNNVNWLGEKKDKVSEHNIQFGEQQAYASALKAISGDGDRLLTGADGYGYINMMAELPLADRQNFYLDWSYRVPKLRAEFEEMMENNPPEFVYFKPYSSVYYEHLTLEENYIELLRDDGSHTYLYIHKDKSKEVHNEQWINLFGQRFLIPTLSD